MIASVLRIESRLRLLVPACLICLLLGLQVLPWPRWSGPLMPALALMGIVYVSARLPSCCPPVFALGLGCCADLLELTPLGAQGLSFLVVTLALRVRRRRVAEQSFLQLWGIFAAIVVLEMIFLWLAEAVLAETVLPPAQLALRAGTSIVLFPLVVKFVLVPAERVTREVKHV